MKKDFSILREVMKKKKLIFYNCTKYPFLFKLIIKLINLLFSYSVQCVIHCIESAALKITNFLLKKIFNDKN